MIVQAIGLKQQIGNWNLSNSQKCLGSPYGGAVTAQAVTERALSAPFGGTSPKRRGKGGCAASLTNYSSSVCCVKPIA